MYRWLESRVLWGTLLIVGGVVFLLQNLGMFRVGDLFFALLFVLGGFFFLTVYFTNRENWWALIPGFTLVAIAVVISLDWIAPSLSDQFSGSIILGGIGISFFAVYLSDREHWWAIIPGGVLLTLAIVAGLDSGNSGAESAGIFFLGMGATFALLALLQTPSASLRWAWIPASILALMGLLMVATAMEFVVSLWPFILIIAGGYMIIRTFGSKS